MLVYSRVSVLKVYSLALRIVLHMLWEFKFLLQKLVSWRKWDFSKIINGRVECCVISWILASSQGLCTVYIYSYPDTESYFYIKKKLNCLSFLKALPIPLINTYEQSFFHCLSWELQYYKLWIELICLHFYDYLNWTSLNLNY